MNDESTNMAENPYQSPLANSQRGSLGSDGKPVMKTCFSYVFWGLLFVILNISINRFDLLPDGLGYVFVAIGCGGLVSLSPQFATARLLSWVLAVLWLVGFIEAPRDVAVIFGVVVTLINCVMVWMLLGGIMDVATHRNRPDLASRAANRRLAYAVLQLVIQLLGFAAHDLRDIAGSLAAVAVVATLVILVMILHLVYRVRSELAVPYPAQDAI
jgi:hypothetical protein